MPNRLADEASPYLLQHKDNPVDWYPWGEEAFSEARRRDVPVLLSVGYAACHWCHVMEHESFEDEGTAQLMNDNFVSIKVDREERPDIDSVYMDAVQALSGQGGWPMTVFLTPDGTPFFGGTYYPPDDRHGLPGFRKVLAAIHEVWRDRRGEVEQQGTRLVGHIASTARLRASADLISDQLLHSALAGLRNAFDPTYGGFGGAPKFPQPMNVDLLLRLARRGHQDAADMAAKTLESMAAGGMFDQLAGGFARYSVDRFWVVPHFEKMLYDNAQLLRSYADAYLLLGGDRFKEVAEATAGWLLAEMRAPEGGFWSSLDADSEGVEGRFYAWSIDEVAEVCGDDADAATEHFSFTREGNFEGLSIPVYAGPPADLEVIERARAALVRRRSSRVRPGTDTKILTAWNALTVTGLAHAGTALGHPEWVDAAADAMDFVLSALRVDGRLMRSYRKREDGRETVRHLGCSEDYAFTLEACLALYEATFEARRLDEARWAADEALRLFLDEEAGGFFTTAVDAEALVVRPKDLVDNALPSANSVLGLQLQRLALFTGDRSYESQALAALRLARDAAERAPLGFGHLLCAVDFYLGEPLEIVIVGDGARPLVEEVRSRYLPNKIVIASARPTEDDVARIPLLEGRSAANGATAYVCRFGECKLPVDTPHGLAEQLETG